MTARLITGGRWLVARVGAGLAVGVPVGIATFLIFLALAYASLGADRNALAGQVRSAFASQQLEVAKPALFGDTDLGTQQFNDCLILYHSIDDRAPRRELAVSPLSSPLESDFPCVKLHTLVFQGADASPRFYHRYLHAPTTLARLLVPSLGVRGTRELYRMAISLLLLAGIAYALIGLARDKTRDADAIWLILFLVFARLFGFETFGQSFGHGPADLLIGYLLLLSRASAGGPLSTRAALLAAAAFGALTMEFEFLTGGLPLGLALVLGTLPLALRPDAALGRTTAGAACAYVAAALACAMAKLAVVLAVFGSAPLTDAGHQLLLRTGIGAPPGRDGPPADWSQYFGRLWAALDALAPGMHWLVVGLLVLSLVAGGWGYRRLRSADRFADRAWATALLGSNLVILLWMVVFWQHTAAHAWFMARLLVWPLASGTALFVLALRRAPNPFPSRESP